jgi:hypothetical protein
MEWQLWAVARRHRQPQGWGTGVVIRHGAPANSEVFRGAPNEQFRVPVARAGWAAAGRKTWAGQDGGFCPSLASQSLFFGGEFADRR